MVEKTPKSAVRSLLQKEFWIFSYSLSELFEKKHSGNKPVKTLLTETLTLEIESISSLRSGCDILSDS